MWLSTMLLQTGAGFIHVSGPGQGQLSLTADHFGHTGSSVSNSCLNFTF